MKRINGFLGVGLLLLLLSCNGKQTLADVAEEDSLCIDTVAPCFWIACMSSQILQISQIFQISQMFSAGRFLHFSACLCKTEC